MCILCFLFDRYKRRKIISNHWSFTQVSQLQFDLECTANGYMQKVIRGRTKPPPAPPKTTDRTRCHPPWPGPLTDQLLWIMTFWQSTSIVITTFLAFTALQAQMTHQSRWITQVTLLGQSNLCVALGIVICVRQKHADETRRDETRDSSQRE